MKNGANPSTVNFLSKLGPSQLAIQSCGTSVVTKTRNDLQ